MPDLRPEEIEAIRDATLSMDQLIREHIHASFTYRFVQSDSYAEAMAIEHAVKGGALGASPPAQSIPLTSTTPAAAASAAEHSRVVVATRSGDSCADGRNVRVAPNDSGMHSARAGSPHAVVSVPARAVICAAPSASRMITGWSRVS